MVQPILVLGELGLADTASGRRRYAERMRQRAVEELAGENLAGNETLRGHWCLGGESFRERMLGLLEKAGEKFSRHKEVDGKVRRSHGEEEARRLLERAMGYYGLAQVELAALKRSDPRKVAMAQLIRQRTSVANGWIARELALGHVSSVSRYSSAGGLASEDELVKKLENAVAPQ